MPGNNDIVITSCSGVTFSTNPGQGRGQGHGNDTFSWNYPPPGLYSGAASGQGRSNITGYLLNRTDSTQYVTYSIIPGNGNSQADPFLVTVILEPCAIIRPLTINTSSGQTFSIVPTNMVDGIVPTDTLYSWQLPVGQVSGGSTGWNRPTISGNLTNLSGQPQAVTYSVTPITSNCTGFGFTVRVTVNPI